MKSIHHLDLILRAANQRNRLLLGMLAEQLADAERAREILRAKGYGATGMTASATAAQVPESKR